LQRQLAQREDAAQRGHLVRTGCGSDAQGCGLPCSQWQPLARLGCSAGLQCRVAAQGCSAGGAASSRRCGSAATAHCTVGSWKVAGPWARPGEAYRSEGGGHRVVERLGEAEVRHVHMRRAVEHACRRTAAGCNPVTGCRLQPCVGPQSLPHTR
jgi:hypothetical protein